MFREPDYAERLEAQAAARAAMLEKLKPKPAVKADEVVPWDAREAQRIRALIEKPRPEKLIDTMMAVAETVAAKPKQLNHDPPQSRVVSDPIRFSVEESAEFTVIICGPAPTIRRKQAAKAWRVREWRGGNRHCFYCTTRTVLGAIGKGRKAAARQNESPPKNLATVDHREPLALGGDDAPWNWVIACWACNNDKGSMTEAQFQAYRTFAVAAE